MAKVGKVQSTLTDYARDGLGLVTTGLLTGTLREIGAIISIWLSPKIAKTSTGKDFNRMFALLCLVDTFMERFTPKGVI
ncbi:MAG: hypothetical protein QXG39_04845 [Candidatus Aenigmatarchaeota archaeon]